jgi:hypothetical membrane protein
LAQQRSTAKQRIGASSAIVAPIFGFTCILAAIASYPAFSWTNNALSDLGIMPGITGPLFNFGLITSGLLAFNFAIFGLLTYVKKSWVGKIGAALFAATSLALISIGIFNEHFSPTHYIVSVAFFTLAPISLFAITCAFWLTHKNAMAAFTIIMGIAAALPWLLLFAFNYVPGVAIPEFTSGLAVSVWTIMLGYKMLKEAPQPEN